MGFVFEDLRVYQRAEANLEIAYRVAAELPRIERFNLAEQLRRAALSVVLNIAESTERRSPRDAGRFIRFALGSVVEVIACFRIAERRYGLDPELAHTGRTAYELLSRQLHAYRRALTPHPRSEPRAPSPEPRAPSPETRAPSAVTRDP